MNLTTRQVVLSLLSAMSVALRDVVGRAKRDRARTAFS